MSRQRIPVSLWGKTPVTVPVNVPINVPTNVPINVPTNVSITSSMLRSINSWLRPEGSATNITVRV